MSDRMPPKFVIGDLVKVDDDLPGRVTGRVEYADQVAEPNGYYVEFAAHEGDAWFDEGRLSANREKAKS